MKTVWKIVGVLVALFIIFYVIVRPEQAAAAVTAVGTFFGNVLTSISRFFTALANG